MARVRPVGVPLAHMTSADRLKACRVPGTVRRRSNNKNNISLSFMNQNAFSRVFKHKLSRVFIQEEAFLKFSTTWVGNDDTHDRRNLYDELIYSIFNLNLCLIPSKNSCAWSLYKAELATTHFRIRLVLPSSCSDDFFCTLFECWYM